MNKILGILLALVFAFLCLLHLYWAFGGVFGNSVAIPSVSEKPLFVPSVSATLAVAFALFLAMLTILGQIGYLGEIVPKWMFRWAALVIAVLFLLRAIGEFKYVGFFKQASDSGFAFWDTVLFSPLCLFIAITSFLISYRKS